MGFNMAIVVIDVCAAEKTTKASFASAAAMFLQQNVRGIEKPIEYRDEDSPKDGCWSKAVRAIQLTTQQ